MESHTTKSKRLKYESHLNDKWLQNPKYMKWIFKIDSKTAKCNYCSVKFTIKWDGEKAVTTHMLSSTHKKCENTMRQNKCMSTFISKKPSTDTQAKTIVELSSIYHSIVHNHSYLSADCLIKLYPHIFTDSEMSKNIHCGRTKMESVVKNILCSKSIEIVLQNLKAGTEKSLFFSISTDASNHGTIKLFPIPVRYFDCDSGIQNKLIDFMKIQMNHLLIFIRI